MRIEKIELNKIKVTLFSEELRMFNINENNMKNNSPELHIFLCEIMKKVRNETNFNPYDGQVVVEATPFEQGLILMVSKIENEVHKKKNGIGKIKHIRAVKKASSDNYYICRFDSFKNFCSMIQSCGNILGDKAVLYKIDKSYYLINKTETADARIAEFSKIYKSGRMNTALIEEHGTVVARGKALGRMADFIAEKE